ncbi:MAG: hypothetical protein H6651_02425 [Ardenticatenales bacterium]|nr:hypothetical protein [Ardenticatenales bacterium]
MIDREENYQKLKKLSQLKTQPSRSSGQSLMKKAFIPVALGIIITVLFVTFRFWPSFVVGYTAIKFVWVPCFLVAGVALGRWVLHDPTEDESRPNPETGSSKLFTALLVTALLIGIAWFAFAWTAGMALLH